MNDVAVPQAAVGNAADASDVVRTIRETGLHGLRYDWGEAYRIGWDARRGWWARRRDNRGGEITATEADELREKIRADYFARPVSRYLPTGGVTGVLTTGDLGGGADLITAEMLRATFDQWRIWETRGRWFATRGGSVTGEGPGSLIHPLVSASTVGGLADQLAMQEHLRRMTAAELQTVWRAGFAAVAPLRGGPS